MAGRIFISYRREDNPAEARALHMRLEREFGADQLFMDVEGIAPGEDFDARLDKTIDESSVVLAVVGPRWLQLLKVRDRAHVDGTAADFVRTEIAKALQRGKTVVPVLVQGGRMPAAAELPADLARFARCNAVEMRHDKFNIDAQALAQSLVPLTGRRPRGQRNRVAGLVLALAAVLGLAAWYVLAGRGGAPGPLPPQPPQPTAKAPAAGVDPNCNTEGFRNATQPGGAGTTMTVARSHGPCIIVNYVNVQQGVRAQRLKIVRQASNGVAEARGNGLVAYTPNANFVGSDSFAYASDDPAQPFAVSVTVKVVAGQ